MKKVLFVLIFTLLIPAVSFGQNNNPSFTVVIYDELPRERQGELLVLLDPYFYKHNLGYARGDWSQVRTLIESEFPEAFAIIEIPGQSPKDTEFIPLYSLDDKENLNRIERSLMILSLQQKERIDLLEKYEKRLASDSKTISEQSRQLINKGLELAPKAAKRGLFGGLANPKEAELFKDIQKTLSNSTAAQEFLLKALGNTRDELSYLKSERREAKMGRAIFIEYEKENFEEALNLVDELKKRGYEVNAVETVFGKITRDRLEREKEHLQIWIPDLFVNPGGAIGPGYGGEEGFTLDQLLRFLDRYHIKEIQNNIKHGVELIDRGEIPDSNFYKKLMEINKRKEEAKKGAIGAKISMNEDRYYLEPLKGSAAEKAGIKKGDAIIKVDGRMVIDFDQDELIDNIRGKVGTPVILTILRDGKTFDVKVTRAVYTSPDNED